MFHLTMDITGRTLGDPEFDAWVKSVEYGHGVHAAFETRNQLSKLIEARSTGYIRQGALSMFLHGVQPQSRMHANYLMRTAYGQPPVEETPDAINEITSL